MKFICEHYIHTHYLYVYIINAMSCSERLYTVCWGVAMSRGFWSESRSDLVTQWYNSVDIWGQSWGDNMGWLVGHRGMVVTGSREVWQELIEHNIHTRSYYILHQVCHTSHGSFLYSNHRKRVNVLTACRSRDWLDLHKELGTIRELLRVNTWSADYPHNFCITSDTAWWCQSNSEQTPNQIYSHTYIFQVQCTH